MWMLHEKRDKSINVWKKAGFEWITEPWPRLQAENSLISYNTITTAAFDGIWLQGSNQLAEGNDISGTVANPGSCLWANIPSWYDANGIEFEGDAQTIRGNRIHDINGWDSRNSLTPHSDGVQMSWGSSSGTIIEKNDISI